MTARDAILGAIRAARVPPAPAVAYPVVSPAAEAADVLRERFLRILREVGGDGALQSEDQSLDDLLDTTLGADRSQAMVLRGRVAVAENAAVYVDAADLARRNDIVRETHLVLVVPRDALVATMHEAVRLLPTGPGCGWFLSGPSKTADIEQSLVFGAQGSRVHRVLLAR
ncbi:MAG: LUD domain-containing protein [Gemmatimonadaceae bacterium]|nr:LUD domain-containing protein [Gemmatimonadaceae bacterium]